MHRMCVCVCVYVLYTSFLFCHWQFDLRLVAASVESSFVTHHTQTHHIIVWYPIAIYEIDITTTTIAAVAAATHFPIRPHK